MDKCTTVRVSWYCHEDLRAVIEPSSCREYKQGDFLALRPLNLDETIHKNDDDENSMDPRAPCGGRSRHRDANDNNNCEGEEDTHGGVKGTGKVTRTKDGKVYGTGKESGREMVKREMYC